MEVASPTPPPPARRPGRAKGIRVEGSTGARITRIRTEAGLSQRALAEAASMSASDVCMLEKGRMAVTHRHAILLGSALGIAPEELLDGTAPLNGPTNLLDEIAKIAFRAIIESAPLVLEPEDIAAEAWDLADAWVRERSLRMAQR